MCSQGYGMGSISLCEREEGREERTFFLVCLADLIGRCGGGDVEELVVLEYQGDVSSAQVVRRMKCVPGETT